MQKSVWILHIFWHNDSIQSFGVSWPVTSWEIPSQDILSHRSSFSGMAESCTRQTVPHEALPAWWGCQVCALCSTADLPCQQRHFKTLDKVSLFLFNLLTQRQRCRAYWPHINMCCKGVKAIWSDYAEEKDYKRSIKSTTLQRLQNYIE